MAGVERGRIPYYDDLNGTAQAYWPTNSSSATARSIQMWPTPNPPPQITLSVRTPEKACPPPVAASDDEQLPTKKKPSRPKGRK